MNVPTKMMQPPSCHHIWPPPGVTNQCGFVESTSVPLAEVLVDQVPFLILEIWCGIMNWMVLLFCQRLKRLLIMQWRTFMITFCTWDHPARFDRFLPLCLDCFQSCTMMMVPLVLFCLPWCHKQLWMLHIHLWVCLLICWWVAPLWIQCSHLDIIT